MNVVKSMTSWAIKVWSRVEGQTFDVEDTWHKGKRIRTKHGMGEIVGGSISVKLDEAVSGLHPNNRTWSFNLDGTRLVDKEI